MNDWWRCNYCQKDKIEPMDYVELSKSEYIALFLRPLKDDGMVLVAMGEGETKYYPKFCPECGRKVNGKLYKE